MTLAVQVILNILLYAHIAKPSSFFIILALSDFQLRTVEGIRRNTAGTLFVSAD